MYAHVIRARRHVVEEALDRNFHLVIVAEAPSGQMFFQLRKQVVVTGCQIRTIGWVGDDVPSKLIQESNGLTGDVGTSVVVEKAYALGQHSSSPVLNRPSEFFECLTIPVGVYCGPMSHEVDQQYPLSIPKHSCHDFAGRLCCFEFSWLGRRGMPPLTSSMGPAIPGLGITRS